MKKGQKLSTSSGVQVALYPMVYLGISQGVLDSYSHKGRLAIDMIGNGTGADEAFAPYDCTIAWIGGKDNIVVWNSDNPHLWANGLVEYSHFCMMHMNDISHLKVGMSFKQGDVIYREGVAGSASANHIHYNVAKGRYSKGYPLRLNEFGKYELYNEVHPVEVLFINDTLIYKDKGYAWKTYKPETVSEAVTVPSTATKYHVVRAGQSLSSIATIYGIKWEDLYAENKKLIGSNPSMIKVGQKLVIPQKVQVSNGTVPIITKQVELAKGDEVYWSGYLFTDSYGTNKTSRSYERTKGVIDIINKNKCPIHIKGKGWVAVDQVTKI